jgi:hypothetical protein
MACYHKRNFHFPEFDGKFDRYIKYGYSFRVELMSKNSNVIKFESPIRHKWTHENIFYKLKVYKDYNLIREWDSQRYTDDDISFFIDLDISNSRDKKLKELGL